MRTPSKLQGNDDKMTWVKEFKPRHLYDYCKICNKKVRPGNDYCKQHSIKDYPPECLNPHKNKDIMYNSETIKNKMPDKEVEIGALMEETEFYITPSKVKNLATAILEVSLKDYLYGFGKDYDDVKAWFNSDNDDIFTFRWCLEYSEINPRIIREYLQECDSKRT